MKPRRLTNFNYVTWQLLKQRMAVFDDRSHVVDYSRAERLLTILQSVGLARWVIVALMYFEIYPSILYTVRKQSNTIPESSEC